MVWKHGAFARMALHRSSSAALKGESCGMEMPRDASDVTGLSRLLRSCAGSVHGHAHRLGPHVAPDDECGKGDLSMVERLAQAPFLRGRVEHARPAESKLWGVGRGDAVAPVARLDLREYLKCVAEVSACTVQPSNLLKVLDCE